jgi:hypothetical protein
VLAIALLGVPCAAPAAPPSAAADIEPVAILARYEATLATLKRPKAMTFDYSVEQLGLRNMEQTHHVYRSGLAERDETLVVDGFTLPRPSVRIIANRSYRYEITAVAPRQTTYAFVYTGSKFGANGLSYVFHTEPRSNSMRAAFYPRSCASRSPVTARAGAARFHMVRQKVTGSCTRRKSTRI